MFENTKSQGFVIFACHTVFGGTLRTYNMKCTPPDPESIPESTCLHSWMDGSYLEFEGNV